MNVITKFINGLRKSFDGKDHLRDIYQCDTCGKPSWSNQCQICQLKDVYDGKYDKKK